MLKYHLNIKYNFLIKSLSVVQIVLEDQVAAMGTMIKPFWESLYVTNAYGKNPIVITLFNAPMTRERWWIAGFVFIFNIVLAAILVWGIILWDRDFRKSLMLFERMGGLKLPMEFTIVGCLSYLVWFFAVLAFYAGI